MFVGRQSGGINNNSQCSNWRMPRRLVREVFSMWKWLETCYSILVLNVKCNNNLCISNILVWLSMSSGVELRLLLTTLESCGFRDIKSCTTCQCKNNTNYPKLPHQQTIVQQTCASFFPLWTKIISQPQQQKHLYPSHPTLRRFEINPQESNPRHLVSFPILDGRTWV